MHDPHFHRCANHPTRRHSFFRRILSAERAQILAHPSEAQNSESIVVDSQQFQGLRAKFLTGIGIVVLAAGMAACSATGDFGRPSPDLTVVGSTLSDDSAPHPLWRSESRPNLSEAERELRNRAWYFLRRCGPYYALGFTNSKPPSISDYYKLLVFRRPPDAAWNKLADDVATDNDLVGQFLRVADSVERTDRRRQRGLWRPSQAAEDAADDLTNRIDENGELIDSVVQAAWFRLAGFGYATERLGLEAPSDQQLKVKALMKTLRRTLSHEPPPPSPGPT
jgi:hypothetical protein